ncbi:MAG: TetR/AcrR family transcriptional regulator [Oscillospiraceae bacterium]|nr:TetR/AcrR family transcriptional regulator [Oscillospiraceae bacterium]
MTKGERTKKKLLEIAYELFITKGYDETSVDDILSIAQIAKGTYYYYFKSKEQMLEEVIDMMIEHQAKAAAQIASAPLPIPQKIIGVISSFRLTQGEEQIGELLERPEDLLMHKKMMEKLINKVTPLLCGLIEEGITSGIFNCNNIPVRVKILLMLSSTLFDDAGQTEEEVTVFIDIAEKILGAEKGTMGFIKALIQPPPSN